MLQPVIHPSYLAHCFAHPQAPSSEPHRGLGLHSP
ncbi:Uncharacterised protein [Vibrio cholerae]|nr:Uncharacterised protein [Vibrio cholerae]CSI71299.1 Uncharacterised protein [Vibrio cholerae]